MPSYPDWLLPNGSLTCALIRLSLLLSTRTVTHTPMADCLKRSGLSTERAKAISAMRSNPGRKRAQQLAIPETYDDQLGR